MSTSIEISDLSAIRLDGHTIDSQRRMTISCDMGDFETIIRGHNFEVSVDEVNELVVAPQDPLRNSHFAITGRNHQVVVRNGRTCIRPLSMSFSEHVQYKMVTAHAYPLEKMLGLRPAGDLNAQTKEILGQHGILKQASPAPVTFGVQWRLACPFASPDLARKDSYMVPQLLAINIRPVPDGNSWRLPKTLIVASTQTAIDHIGVKVKTVLANLGKDLNYRGLGHTSIHASRVQALVVVGVHRAMLGGLCRRCLPRIHLYAGPGRQGC
jgi:hypothetical protein